MKNVTQNDYSRNVLRVGFTSFLNDVSSEMILPILPLLIAQVGGSGIAIGLIGGLRDSGSEILKFYFGYLSDRIKKRTFFIYTGYIVSAIFKFLLALTTSWQMIFILIGLERFGKALRTAPRDALITESTPTSIGKSFGIHRAMDTAGAILGSCITTFLIWKYNMSLIIIIMLAGIIGLLSIFPLFSVIEPKQETTKTPLTLSAISFSGPLIIFTIIASIFSIANISYMFFILHAQNILNHSSPAANTMLLYTLFNIVYTIFSIPLGMLSDRIGRWNVMVFGYLVYALCMASFLYATSIISFMLCFALYGIALATIKVNHKSFAADLASQHGKASTLGFFESITGITTFFAGLIAGTLWQYTGSTVVFSLATGIALLSCCLMIVYKKTFSMH